MRLTEDRVGAGHTVSGWTHCQGRSHCVRADPVSGIIAGQGLRGRETLSSLVNPLLRAWHNVTKLSTFDTDNEILAQMVIGSLL